VATIHCRCGRIFSDASIPCNEEYHLLSDVTFDDVCKDVIRLVNEDRDVEVDVGYAILNASKYVYKCPYCGRLIVFWDGLEQKPRFYKPE
jgi:hypothetical protein